MGLYLHSPIRLADYLSTLTLHLAGQTYMKLYICYLPQENKVHKEIFSWNGRCSPSPLFEEFAFGSPQNG